VIYEAWKKKAFDNETLIEFELRDMSVREEKKNVEKIKILCWGWTCIVHDENEKEYEKIVHLTQIRIKNK
jgi:hypothetical protein